MENLVGFLGLSAFILAAFALGAFCENKIFVSMRKARAEKKNENK